MKIIIKCVNSGLESQPQNPELGIINKAGLIKSPWDSHVLT